MQGKVLVVEPDTSVRNGICAQLAAEGCDVTGVADVRKALDAREVEAPDLIFAALANDPKSVLALMNGLRAGGLDRPFVVLSDQPYPDSYPELMGKGVFAYLEKPLLPSRLLEVAAMALDLRETREREVEFGRERNRLHTVTKELVADFPGLAVIVDVEGRVIFANRAATSFLGAVEGRVAGLDYISLLPAAMREPMAHGFDLLYEGEETCTVELRRGETVLDVSLRAVRTGGQLETIVLLGRDVTAQRRSEQNLIENEQRYRSVFEAGRDAILLISRKDGSVLDWNQAARNLYGYASRRIKNLNYIHDLSTDPDLGLEVLEAVPGRVSIRNHRRKDGSSFPAETTMSTFSVGEEQVVTVFVRDITSRKVVEEALREGARLYRAVVEDQTELICRFRPNGVLTFVNRAYTRFFGGREDAWIGVNLKEHIQDVDLLERLFQWGKHVTQDDPAFEIEQQFRNENGQIQWVRWTNRGIFDHRGELREFQAVGRDVTESRLAAEALRRANEEKERFRLNLEATFRSIPDAIITVDGQMKVMTTNSAAEQLCGISSEASCGLELGQLVNCDPNPCAGVLKQVLKTRRPVKGFQAQLDLNSGERMVELNSSPLLDEGGEFIGAVLVVKDVSRIADLEKRLQERHGFRGIVGKSDPMQDVYRLLEQLAPLDATVLICGESGTGKELAADALHYGGGRAAGQMVKVNCSALSESLLESELFGHVRGAFTGAVRDKVGRIGAAEGGTLLLDEIADVSPLIQLKLLRFLEQKEYERVGESVTRKADVRIIAATNVDLKTRVESGSFREDLFYRLNVMPVHLPPLRDREGDIPLLVEHFLKEFSQSLGKELVGVSEEVMSLFLRYDWPGNIRELKHLLEHACILCRERIIPEQSLRPDVAEVMRYGRRVKLPEFGKPKVGVEAIVAALQEAEGNKSKAAQLLGMHRATLYRKMRNLGLDA